MVSFQSAHIAQEVAPLKILDVMYAKDMGMSTNQRTNSAPKTPNKALKSLTPFAGTAFRGPLA